MGIYKLQRVYYKRTESETSWTQPVLSANGTIGGDSFACAASSEYDPAWKAFDNNTSTVWTSPYVQLPQWIEWYDAKGLKISSLIITYSVMNYGAGAIRNYKVQVSDNGNDWVDVYSGNDNKLSVGSYNINITINNNNFYKHWRFYIVSSYNSSYIDQDMFRIHNIAITATTLEETIVPSTADDYDFYEDKMLKIGEFYKGSTKIGSLYKGSILVFGKTQTIFEETTPGIYTITIPYEADFKITAVGAGGRANYRCAYDDRGYIGCGGSGGAFIGKIHLTPGRYDVQIGSCAAGSSRTTFINEVLTVGGGGDGATNPIGGAAGAAPILNITPVSEDLNRAGNAGGAYSSGNGGGGATWNYGGAASVYGGYGRGGGGKVCEYSWASSANEGSGEPFNPTNGYLKIEL